MIYAKSKSTYLKPKNVKTKYATIISGKTRYYYPINFKNPTILTVRGPGELRIITRAIFSPDENEEVNYEIRYNIDGGKEKKKTMKYVVRSKKATFKDGSLGVPGELKDFKIKLKRGYHTIELKRKEELPKINARFGFTASKIKKKEWIALAPLSPTEPVDLIVHESEVNYYRFSTEKPLKVEIIGPTELRILTRVENNYDMKSGISYRLQINKDNKVINTYMLYSKRSEVATYKDNGKLVPGKAREIYIEVPKGKQVFEIVPLDPTDSSLLAKILFPKNDAELKD